MSVKSKSRHYLWHNIQLRHWFATATECQFTHSMMQSIIDEVFDNMETVIKKVTSQLPENFPAQVSDSIFKGMRQVKDRCLTLR